MWSGPQAFLMLTFPSMSVTSPNLILSGWISGSKVMTFWKFSLALATTVLPWQRLSCPGNDCLHLVKNVVLDFVGEALSNWDANVYSFSVVVTDLIFIPPSSLETRVGYLYHADFGFKADLILLQAVPWPSESSISSQYIFQLSLFLIVMSLLIHFCNRLSVVLYSAILVLCQSLLVCLFWRISSLISIGKPIEFRLMDFVGTFSAMALVIVLVSVST